MKTLEKSRIRTIASEIGCNVYFELFDDKVKKEYHDNKINLHAFIEENIFEVLESLLGSDLLEQSEFELLEENNDYILDDIITNSVPFLVGEIETDKMDD